MTHKDFLNQVHKRNKIRAEIKQKKSNLAKMLQHPEMLEESLILKSEIETLELELELTMK